jgi:hypothetical protein
VKLTDKKTGKIRVEIGEALIFPEPTEEVLGQGKVRAIDLKSYEYVRLEDKRTGKIRVERGEQLVFPTAFEEVLDGGKQEAIDLKSYSVRCNRRTSAE